ncbi:MAG: tRNA (guanosine(46)-N7)-methyltransferase TrmB [Cytophagales bacterium]|jgi:tRNA (guanine-N7-)-methyltransferase|nr:tRNA (guanosine(46)-N7)-methyltransferase TrmB [Cytophagales bacterium]MCA6367350.1 tRNA (guanosine(46)-N7)-methyltransferase TrmB [Cytophagales bacterium]MCA6371707.1 tRNA (guanosine(46)-N7)-methyltransferase TrmB [Cytophagales bacterium]MCA6376165.1 tRNA (guanosine(46)-N7)-methyltransferase TrmB [Cytophagales bacterium]MCA6383985.1 tRNA (guanosine(46)-N7)-methyltransferase TrmB [Cytophagales bacterium]
MKSKLKRFEIIAGRQNVIEPGKELFNTIKGKWRDVFFKNQHPITIELACGRGEYSVNLARQFPDRNYIGVDKKGDRLWKGSTWAVEDNLQNVAFLRTGILFIESFFEVGEVNEVWLTFPDPLPRKRDAKRRLSSTRYLDMYKKILAPDGYFRFKTDNTDLFNFTLEELGYRNDLVDFKYTHDLYQSVLRPECFDIKTKYEEMFSAQGEVIKYLRFRFAH